MRAFSFTHQCQTESIHDITGMVTFLCNPVHNDFFLSFNAKIFNTGNHFCQFGHTFCRIFFPAFLHRLFIIFGRSHKEEATNIPQFFNETYPVFHHANHSHYLFERSLYALFFQERQEQFRNFFVRFLLYILMIEPYSFFIVELSSRLAATVKIKQFNQFVHRHHFLIIARIPSQ